VAFRALPPPPHFLAVVSLASAWDRAAAWACGYGSRAAGGASRGVPCGTGPGSSGICGGFGGSSATSPSSASTCSPATLAPCCSVFARPASIGHAAVHGGRLPAAAGLGVWPRARLLGVECVRRYAMYALCCGKSPCWAASSGTAQLAFACRCSARGCRRLGFNIFSLPPSLGCATTLQNKGVWNIFASMAAWLIHPIQNLAAVRQ
jgi:hypothetical protein